MKSLLKVLSIIFLLWIVTSVGFAHVPSKERGDPTFRRKTNIDGNQVRTTIFNFCFSGRTGAVPDEIPYEWPKNTLRHYIALVAPFFAGEVKNSPSDSAAIHIVDVPTFRQSPAGATWNLEPVPNYFNTDPRENKIAKSDDPASWPAEWPDKLTDTKDPGWKGAWNGYFGKNQFNADQEMFFKASDDRYNRYTYEPDSTDVNRRGLGLNIESRVMEWSQVLVNDVVYIIYNVQNDGTKDIPLFGVNIWLADFVGGDADAAQNHAYFDLRNFVAWSTDCSTCVGGPEFAGTKVGVAATSYLETPGNAGDRIDNDGDGESGGKIITPDMLVGEDAPGQAYDGIDNNHNGLIDENLADTPFGNGVYKQTGVTYADGIDNNGNGEVGSPVVTQQMIDDAATDSYQGHQWHRWPPNPESDPMQQGIDGQPIIHLIGVAAGDLGHAFKDNIDNDGNDTVGYVNLPRVTQSMIDSAATDKYHRYRVAGTNVILYNLVQADFGKR